MKAPSLSAVREALAAHAPGITIRKDESGEYRVTFTQEAIAAAFPGMTRAERIEKAESLASYDSDICAAYETGKAMFRVGLVPATATPEETAAREAAADMGFATEMVSESPVVIGTRETVRLNLRRQAEGMAEIANRENPATVAVRTIDATPTWAGVLPMLRAAIENGTAEGRRIAWEELARMAEAADKWNASAKA